MNENRRDHTGERSTTPFDRFARVLGSGLGSAQAPRHDLVRDSRLPADVAASLLAKARDQAQEFFSATGSTLDADEWQVVADWTARTDNPQWQSAWLVAQSLLGPESNWRSTYEAACADFDQVVEKLPGFSAQSCGLVRRYARSTLASWVLTGHVCGHHQEQLDLWQRFHDEML